MSLTPTTLLIPVIEAHFANIIKSVEEMKDKTDNEYLLSVFDKAIDDCNKEKKQVIDKLTTNIR